jgi:hypothetical protein
VRRLAVALARTFFGVGSQHARALEESLGNERRWSVDDRLLEAAQAVMGMALAARPGPRETSGGQDGLGQRPEAGGARADRKR